MTGRFLVWSAADYRCIWADFVKYTKCPFKLSRYPLLACRPANLETAGRCTCRRLPLQRLFALIFRGFVPFWAAVAAINKAARKPKFGYSASIRSSLKGRLFTPKYGANLIANGHLWYACSCWGFNSWPHLFLISISFQPYS